MLSTSSQRRSCYRVHILEGAWTFSDINTGERVNAPESLELIGPGLMKWFDGDVVDISTPIPTLVESDVRTEPLAGVLILEGGQTYGRTKNKKRLLYKCVPDNKALPAFLVPYEPEIGFSKKLQNRYVVFKYDDWTNSHPCGILVENLGEVGNLGAFNEYQLYCKHIYRGIAEFTKTAKARIRDALDSDECDTLSVLPHVFTIDPAGSTDQDDAISILQTSPFTVVVAVYIADAYYYLEKYGLWESFGNRISTIYLPDFKRPMLPTILSDQISLVAGRQRRAVCMEVYIVNGTIRPEHTRFYNTSVKVIKNYVYESQELLKDPHYKLLSHHTRLLDPEVQSSNDVVAYWMVQMNTICGEILKARGCGIFRQASVLPDSLDADAKKTVHYLRNTSCQYVAHSAEADLSHEIMGKDAYVHITSPIRRLVDLLNQIVFQNEIGEATPRSLAFVESWMTRMDYINRTMRSIKKVQMDCELLYLCNTNPEITGAEHLGMLFDRRERRDGFYSYTVCLQFLHLKNRSTYFGRLKSREFFENYSVLPVNVFVFECDKKIRLGVRTASDRL